MQKVLRFNKSANLLLFANVVFFALIGISLVIINNLQHKQQIPQSLLAPHVTMGEIELKVANFSDMENFYTKILGMQVVSKDNSSIVLGYDKTGVLKLDNTPSLRQSSPSDPGLDQLAIVFNSRPGLARVLKRIMSANPTLYQGGTSRGAVGEAFYVVDPQGNSLELYFDTDPSTWPRSSLGNVEGSALPIDINQYVSQYAEVPGDNGMKTGHLQIRIGDINAGRQFYLDTVGFYAPPSLLGNGQSLFMSDGYYHHDFVINQAQGYDGDQIDNYLGLKGFAMGLPNMSYVSGLKNRLKQANISYQTIPNGIIFKDPWGVQITVTSLDNSLWSKISSLITL